MCNCLQWIFGGNILSSPILNQNHIFNWYSYSYRSPNKYLLRLCRWLWHIEVTLFFSLSSPFPPSQQLYKWFFWCLGLCWVQFKLSNTIYFGKIMTHELEIFKQFLLASRKKFFFFCLYFCLLATVNDVDSPLEYKNL